MNSTLEQLENDIWSDIEHESRLTRICHQLRKKPLKDFEIEDLRIMIGQNIGLNHLIPLAIEKLKVDINVEGDFYPGDLLKSVLTSDIIFWKQHQDLWAEMCNLIESNKNQLENPDDFEWEISLFQGIVK